MEIYPIQIALPTGYYLVSGWLDAYEYRTPIRWWVFAGTCVAAILITAATVSVQAIKAALLNPAHSLKSD
jgi:hypothetical protein